MLSVLGKSTIVNNAVKAVSYFSPSALILGILFTALGVLFYRRQTSRTVRLINKITGPGAAPIIGNAIEMNLEHDEFFSMIMGMRLLWGRDQGFNRAWIGMKPYVFVSNPECVEPILSSPKHIMKSYDYTFLRPWLGTGLLTSWGQKWHSRRKILTPAFHFKILDDFVDVFNDQSAILVKKLESQLKEESFNIFPFVTLCTLDIICETAMGRTINAQENSDSDYVKAIYEISSIIQNRQAKIWLQPEIIFRFSKDYKRHKECLNILHGFSLSVIKERKEQVAAQKAKNHLNNNNIVSNNKNISNHENADLMNNNEEQLQYTQLDDDFGKKKKLAFLDLLIEASKDGDALSTNDMREEVDTFMFEGHDTTSAAISWSLFLLGSAPECQDRLIAELDEIFDGDRDRAPTMQELNNMKYLECVIKEALRLYPSVPMFGRTISEDIKLGDTVIPAGTTTIIAAYQLHRNPKSFPQPEVFNPDNFTPEKCRTRHPYAYIPFSAGPRNCIGQKFALLEEKAVLSAILRKYKVEAVARREDLTLLGELILRPKSGLEVKITARP